MAKKITALEIFTKLSKEDSIVGKSGKIVFGLNKIQVIIDSKDIIGTVLQSWLSKWMSQNNYSFKCKPNTQEFPDFMLDVNNPRKDILEVKAFDYDASPNFDVANFEAYCNSLKTDAYRIDADYLIFGYSLHPDSLDITVENIWLLKIWGITGPSNRFPVRVQAKRDMIYNIRPINWYSLRSRFGAFASREKFITSLYLTLMTYSKTKDESHGWLRTVCDNYRHHTKNDLLPRKEIELLEKKVKG